MKYTITAEGAGNANFHVDSGMRVVIFKKEGYEICNHGKTKSNSAYLLVGMFTMWVMLLVISLVMQ